MSYARRGEVNGWPLLVTEVNPQSTLFTTASKKRSQRLPQFVPDARTALLTSPMAYQLASQCNPSNGCRRYSVGTFAARQLDYGTRPSAYCTNRYPQWNSFEKYASVESSSFSSVSCKLSPTGVNKQLWQTYFILSSSPEVGVPL
ncbi:unnamed protein product [Toxocara canis]|uniref:DUF4005 domain-containing protein n=1 Tax=Toxocara canis TaxID=6265 RepID=A0A183TY14_TOXCA|nr:unnamed protein product [Toxocara canis]